MNLFVWLNIGWFLLSRYFMKKCMQAYMSDLNHTWLLENSIHWFAVVAYWHRMRINLHVTLINGEQNFEFQIVLLN